MEGFRPRGGRFAAAPARCGVGFGDRVLLPTLNRTEVLQAILGIDRLGAIAVPINVRLPPPEIVSGGRR